MGIVLVITSIVAVGVMVSLTDSLMTRQLSDTTAKLEAIQKALYDYRVAFDRCQRGRHGAGSARGHGAGAYAASAG